MNIKKYFKVWYLTSAAAIKTDLSKRFSATLLLLGKGVRIILFGSFLLVVLSGSKNISGYTPPQALVFYLTFNLIDTLSQLFLRGSYYFRSLVLKGDLDYLLAHPINPLFSVLFSHTDVLDFIIFWPLLAVTVYSILGIPGFGLLSYLIYFTLVFNGLLIAAGFHILVISLAVTTYEVDNALMIYRDLSSLARVPVDLYREPIRFLITFVLPVGIMMTFPVKALFGLLSVQVILLTIVVSVMFFCFSIFIWNRSIKNYSSASS